jgi:hypothetical protein
LTRPEDETFWQLICLSHRLQEMGILDHVKVVWIKAIVYRYHLFRFNPGKLHYIFLDNIRDCDDCIGIVTVKGGEGVSVASVIPEVGFWNHESFGAVDDKYFLCPGEKWDSELWIKDDIEPFLPL